MTRAIGLYICFNEMPIPVIVKKPKKNEHKRKKKAVSAATI